MTAPFIIRPGTVEDSERIAQVHVRSIRTLGAAYYDAEVISAWGRARSGEPYVLAMSRGEKFFVASMLTSHDLVGFSSYRVEDGKHRTAIYVVGETARQGIGTALFREAASAAREAGATEIYVAASLAAVEFYAKNGFAVLGRGTHQLSTGAIMECVFMKKPLVGDAAGR